MQALKIGNKGLIRASRERLVALGIPADQVKQLEKTRKVSRPYQSIHRRTAWCPD